MFADHEEMMTMLNIVIRANTKENMYCKNPEIVAYKQVKWSACWKYTLRYVLERSLAEGKRFDVNYLNRHENSRDQTQSEPDIIWPYCSQHDFDALKNKYTELTAKVAVLVRSENTTLALQGEISDLKNLKSIHQLQDLTALQSQVNTISAQTHSLAVKEQARNEDFRALYNLTVNQKQMTDKSIKALESETINNMKALAFNTSNTIKTLELNTNNSVDLMSNSFGMKTQNLEGILNSSMAGLQQQIASSNKRGMFVKYHEFTRLKRDLAGEFA
ncbi:unnamed protein product [Mytilus edulis]|uniref:Uncharacterized protein n=1 Tax=Mytilus edulis TaxID=6550 RepID=A0A8S3SF49_MYTED|nr:unnamed protein product [Mytilus edulis]